MNIGHCQKGHESHGDQEGMGHRLERSLQDPPGRSGRNGPPTGAVSTRPATSQREAAAKGEILCHSFNVGAPICETHAYDHSGAILV